METPLAVISALSDIRERKSRLAEREAVLIKPLLTNWALMPKMYTWFKEILCRREPEPQVESPTQRRKILFVFLYLYAPVVLTGGKTPSGLRDAMAKAIHLKDVTFISHNIDNVVFHYQNYKEFQHEVNAIFEEIKQRMVAEKLVQMA